MEVRDSKPPASPVRPCPGGPRRQSQPVERQPSHAQPQHPQWQPGHLPPLVAHLSTLPHGTQPAFSPASSGKMTEVPLIENGGQLSSFSRPARASPASSPPVLSCPPPTSPSCPGAQPSHLNARSGPQRPGNGSPGVSRGASRQTSLGSALHAPGHLYQVARHPLPF